MGRRYRAEKREREMMIEGKKDMGERERERER